MHDLFGCARSRGSEMNFRLVALVITSSMVALLSGCGTSGPMGSAAASSPMVPPLRVSAARMARLPAATTFGRLRGAPLDPDPFSPETGVVIHPTVARAVYAYPGGQPVAVLPATELSSPTWVPVVQSRPGWDRVLLPTRPNRSTGWIFLGGSGLQTAYSAYQVEISLAAHRLTVLDRGRQLGSWTVAVGAPGTPTPTGRTFLLASVAPRHPTYSPLILPLGVHSHTLSSFGGGPGTVGLHGWPDPSVFGHGVSHGCVRVPPAALQILSRIPLGSPVAITS
jgi:lipoprotein-anchoring transpeptidase ErfK/SrfK